MSVWAREDWLTMRAGTRPDSVAIVFADTGEAWTWAALGARSAAVRDQLVDAGVGPSHRVLVRCRTPRTAAPALFGVWLAGACAVPAHPRWTSHELAHAVSVVEPTAVIGDAPDAWSGPALEVSDARGAIGVSTAAPDAFPVSDAWLDEYARWRREGSDCEQPMLVVMTSGTTGAAKAAVLPKRAILASAASSALRLGVEADDRWLACMPLSHVGGAMILLRSVLYGTTVVAMDGFDATEFASVARAHSVTLASVVPTMLRRVLDAGGEAPSTLRATLVGGAAAAPDLLVAASRAGWRPRATWGLTEAASQVCTVEHGAPPDRGDVGPALPGLEVRVRAPDDGGTGELEVRGPTLMSGYLGDADATRAALDGGWLRTGDVGVVRDGRVTVLARRTDLIVTGGENVYPAEVEAAIVQLDAVSEAAVIGVPDDVWGACVVACLVVRDGAAEPGIEALRAALRPRLAAYKLPRGVVRLRQPLPRTSTGKVDRAAVRRLLDAGAPTAAGSTLTTTAPSAGERDD